MVDVNIKTLYIINIKRKEKRRGREEQKMTTKKWVKTMDSNQCRAYWLDENTPSIWWYSFKGSKPYRVKIEGIEASFSNLKEAKQFVSTLKNKN